MKNVLKFSGLLFFLFLLNSCEREEDILIDSQGVEQESNTIKYVYGPIVKTEESFSKNKSFKAQQLKGTWQKIEWEHLANLSRNADINYLIENDALNRFTSVINKGNTRPKNVSINDVKLGGGQNPSHLFGWKAEMRPNGRLISVREIPLSSFKRVKGTASRSERNRSGKKKFMKLPGQWRIETSNTSNWHVTGSISATVGVEANLVFAKSSLSTTVSMEAGGGGSTSQKITEVIEGGGIWVPKGKVANWELTERHRDYVTKWEVPLQFQGRVGADYGKKFQGHYFWAVSADSYFYEYTRRNKKYILDVTEEYGKELRIQAWVTDN